MRKYGYLLVISILMVVLAVPIFAQGQLAESPWPIERGDLRNSGLSSFVGPKNPLIAWSLRLNSGSAGTVLGSDGVIYVTMTAKSEGTPQLMAVNPDGTIKWLMSIAERVRSTPVIKGGIISSEDTLYIITDESNTLFAIRCSDGSVKWKTSIDITTQGSATIGKDGTIYISGTAKLVAVNPDGKIKWSISAPAGGATTPAIDFQGIIYVAGMGGRIAAIHPDGIIKWEKTLFESDIYASVCLDLEGNIYVAGRTNGTVMKLNKDGNTIWSYSTGGGNIVCTPSLGPDGSVYVTDKNRLHKINGENGEAIWVHEVEGDLHASVVVDAEGNAYAAAWNAMLYAINPDGTPRWSLELDSPLSYPNFAIIGENGTLYIASPKRSLYAIVNK